MIARCGKSGGQKSTGASRALPDGLPSGTETEVKFATTPEGFQQAFRSPQLGGGLAARSQTLRSIYFDTPERDLFSHGIVLRLRKSAGTPPVMTVKMPAVGHAGPFRRRETEVRAASMAPNFELFESRLARHLRRLTGEQPLEAQFETRVTRRTRQIDIEDAAIEIAFDEGKIVTTGGAQLAICEIELELKSGDVGHLYGLASRAAESLPLRLDIVSKSEKGFRLRSGESPLAVKAKVIDLKSSATFDQLIASVLAASLTQFAANWAPLLESDAAEPIHQLRVSLRRLRSALKIFGRRLNCGDFDALRAEAKRIATALGEARALDALHSDAAKGPMASPSRPVGCGALMARTLQRRASAHEQARELIKDTATTLFILQLQTMIARHGWREGLVESGGGLLSQPARDFAAGALDKLLARARKRGGKLLKRSDEERHALRIALKDLRYGIEFFAGLFGHARKVTDYLALLGTLQDILGAHNDAITSAKLLQDLSAGCEPEIVHAAGYVEGWQTRGRPMTEQSLGNAWKALKALKPFWH